MQPTRINPDPCPRCGGKLEFKDTCGSLKTGSPVAFFSAKTAVTFIQLSDDLRKCALSVAVLKIILSFYNRISCFRALPLKDHQTFRSSRTNQRWRTSMTQFILNQIRQNIDAEPDVPLLWAVREIASLTGTKFGCGHVRLLHRIARRTTDPVLPNDAE